MYVQYFFEKSIFYFSGNGIPRFANTLGNHMVLQRAPQRAIVWGFGDSNTLTTLEMNDKIYTTRIFLGIKDLVLFTSLTSNNEKISMPTLNSWADWLDIVQHQIIIVSGYQFKIIEFNREFFG